MAKDILYVVGSGSIHDDIELRWSLRSIAKFGHGVGRVIVAGHIPRWLSDQVVKLPMNEEAAPDGNVWKVKHRNILTKILRSIDLCGLHQDFLWSSDDHFYVKDVDFDSYPVFIRGEVLETEQECIVRRGKCSSWRRSLSDTRALLERNGYRAVNFAFHANTHLDGRDAAEVRRLMDQEPVAEYGYEPACLFLNVRLKRDPAMHIVPRRDFKLRRFAGMEAFRNRLGDLEAFSVGDRPLDDGGFRQVMNGLYGEKCIYEL